MTDTSRRGFFKKLAAVVAAPVVLKLPNVEKPIFVRSIPGHTKSDPLNQRRIVRVPVSINPIQYEDVSISAEDYANYMTHGGGSLFASPKGPQDVLDLFAKNNPVS